MRYGPSPGRRVPRPTQALPLLLALALCLFALAGCGDLDGSGAPKGTSTPMPTPTTTPKLSADTKSVLDGLDSATEALDTAPTTGAIDLDLDAIAADPGETTDPSPLLTDAAGMEKDLSVPVPTVDTVS